MVVVFAGQSSSFTTHNKRECSNGAVRGYIYHLPACACCICLPNTEFLSTILVPVDWTWRIHAGSRTGPSGYGEQFDTATTLRDVYGGKMHARCVTLFVYHVSGPQVNLHKSDFNTHILYGVVPVCPHRADAPRSAGSCRLPTPLNNWPAQPLALAS